MATITEKQLKNSKAGGALMGKRNGQTMVFKDGSLGGYGVGRMHSEGGIKAKVKGGQDIEFQGNEVVITAPAVADNTKHEFNGQMLTNRQILSKINQAGGGVSFAKGGDIPKTVRCSGKKYTYGGKLKTDHEIVAGCGCKHEQAEQKANGGKIKKTNKKKSKPKQDTQDPYRHMIENGGSVNVVYRAMSEAELQRAIETGEIKSNLSMALPIEQHLGLTGFGDSPDDTMMYAKLNLQRGGKSYIAEISHSGDMRSDYVEASTLMALRNELASELSAVEKTLEKKGPDWDSAKQFQQWVKSNKAELEKIDKQINELGLPEELLATAPKGVRLPYKMTPKPVSTDRITKLWELNPDGTKTQVDIPKNMAKGGNIDRPDENPFAWKNIHKLYFLPIKPGLTNFTEIVVGTMPVVESDWKDVTKPGDPVGSPNNPFREVVDIKPFQQQKSYGDGTYTVDKLYVYIISFQDIRDVWSPWPTNLFESIRSYGGDMFYAKFDNDKKTVFAPYPFEYEGQRRYPEEVFDLITKYVNEMKQGKSMAKGGNVGEKYKLSQEGDDTFNYSDFSYQFEKTNKPPKRPSPNMFSGKGGTYTGGGDEKSMKGVMTNYKNKYSDHSKKMTDAYIAHVQTELKAGKIPSVHQIRSYISTLYEAGNEAGAIELLNAYGFTKGETGKWQDPVEQKTAEPEDTGMYKKSTLASRAIADIVKKNAARETEDKKKYEVTFEDLQTFGIDKKTCFLTDSQYQTALKQKEDRDIVVNKLINHIHMHLVIKDIVPVK